MAARSAPASPAKPPERPIRPTVRHDGIDGFSQERLEKLLNRLDLHVRIQVGPCPEWTDQAGVAVELVDAF